MGTHIIRDRIDKSMLSGIKLGDFELEGLTCNNIIICSNITIAKKLRDELMLLKNSSNNLTLYLWDEKLLELTDDEFEKELYYLNYLDGIIVEEEFDCITIQFRDYAIQKFYITTTPEVINLANSVNDIWFVGENKCLSITEFKGGSVYFEDKNKLIKNTRFGRFNL